MNPTDLCVKYLYSMIVVIIARRTVCTYLERMIDANFSDGYKFLLLFF